jgi:hypothetical protein
VTFLPLCDTLKPALRVVLKEKESMRLPSSSALEPDIETTEQFT